MSLSHRSLWLAGFVLAVLPFAGCSSGGECDTCTIDADCKPGLFCSRFDDQSMRCSEGLGTLQCRVR